MNSLTDQAAKVLAEIDAALAICEKATVGLLRWEGDCLMESDGAIIMDASTFGEADTAWLKGHADMYLTSRTVCPKSLRCLKTAIEGLLKRAVFYPPTEVSHFAETQLTAIITKWNENK